MSEKHFYQCRACLQFFPASSLHPLDDEDTRTLFEECSSVELKPMDVDERHLCTSCLTICSKWNNFQELAVESDSQLKLSPPIVPGQCRVCLVVDSSTQSVTDEGTRNMFIECTSILLLSEDNDPLQLCKICLAECLQWHNFKSMALDSDRQLNIGSIKEEIDDEETSDDEDIETTQFPGFDDDDEVDVDDGGAVEGVKVEYPIECVEAMMPETVSQSESAATESSSTVPSNTPGDGRDRNCTYCGKIYNRRSHLRQHLKIAHGVQFRRSFQCETCGKTYKHEPFFLKHKRSHEKTYKCDVCGRTCRTYQLLFYHKKVHDKDCVFTCDQCGKSFKRREKLKYHIKRLHTVDGNSFLCKVCSKGFPHQYNLDLHMRCHSEDRPHKCNLCEKAFRYAVSLGRHVLTHSNYRAGTEDSTKEFKCNLCGREFHDQGSMKRHLFAHTRTAERLSKKQFKCPEPECVKAFGHPGSLKRHMYQCHPNAKKKEEVEKHIKCHLCVKTFGHPNSLTRHLRVKHGGGRRSGGVALN